MSDREDKLTRALQLTTDVRSLLDSWAARLQQALDANNRLSDLDRRDVMVTANTMATKVMDLVLDGSLRRALALTQEVALADNLKPLMGEANANDVVAIAREVFGEVEP